MFINCIQRQEQKPPQLFIRILLPMIITIVTLISSIIFILELNGANVSADEQRSLSLLNASNKKIEGKREISWSEIIANDLSFFFTTSSSLDRERFRKKAPYERPTY